MPYAAAQLAGGLSLSRLLLFHMHMRAPCALCLVLARSLRAARVMRCAAARCDLLLSIAILHLSCSGVGGGPLACACGRRLLSLPLQDSYIRSTLDIVHRLSSTLISHLSFAFVLSSVILFFLLYYDSCVFVSQAMCARARARNAAVHLKKTSKAIKCVQMKSATRARASSLRSRSRSLTHSSCELGRGINMNLSDF